MTTLRFVELDTTGRPFHEFSGPIPDGPEGDAVWAQLVTDAAHKGHTVVRLKDSRYARNPNLEDIEGDGKGGFRAKPGKPDALRDVEVMK